VRNYDKKNIWLDKNLVRTFEKLVKALNVGNVSDCLHAMKTFKQFKKKANGQCSTRII